mmetsp:Transcript_56132/g.168027  ORF Transcript_56132/g.168027 Transcript_56132/m.168027 type:complete len:249 (+) Transcript_56132:136-882(+)
MDRTRKTAHFGEQFRNNQEATATRAGRFSSTFSSCFFTSGSVDVGTSGMDGASSLPTSPANSFSSSANSLSTSSSSALSKPTPCLRISLISASICDSSWTSSIRLRTSSMLISSWRAFRASFPVRIAPRTSFSFSFDAIVSTISVTVSNWLFTLSTSLILCRRTFNSPRADFSFPSALYVRALSRSFFSSCSNLARYLCRRSRAFFRSRTARSISLMVPPGGRLGVFFEEDELNVPPMVSADRREQVL